MTPNFRLSPSTLNIFLECPRCFWLHMRKKIQRPRGIFPSLPGGMDMVIKEYFDSFRKTQTLPPEIKDKIDGRLFPDQVLLSDWRNWRKGLVYADEKLNAMLTGALDDCIVLDNCYIPLDYKTRGFAPDSNSRKYYGNQLDCYLLLLEANGFKTPDYAYLVYYYPHKVKNGGMVEFSIEPVKVSADAQQGRETFTKAIKLLAGPIPVKNNTCEYCSWLEKRAGFNTTNAPERTLFDSI
ncbi:MAG: PD-(D/E)XK nuclease family protein [Candidatus Omnitrophota bacterium]